MDAVWHKIRASNFPGLFYAVIFIPTFDLARQEVLEKQVAVFLWDGIRLSRRHNRGQMVVYYGLEMFQEIKRKENFSHLHGCSNDKCIFYVLVAQ